MPVFVDKFDLMMHCVQKSKHKDDRWWVSSAKSGISHRYANNENEDFTSLDITLFLSKSKSQANADLLLFFLIEN